MTIINPNSISGISSITALNSTAAINLFKADGTSANIIAGVTTGANFITGTSNVHSTGYECTNINASGIITATSMDMFSTDAGSSAAPEFKLYRNSASPADADYLGQIKFAGESDTGVERNYAKITGKILDASNGTEDGILEFAHIKAGSQVITGRWRSDSLQLLNGTNFSVAGTSEFTGVINANNGINLTDSDNKSILLGASDDMRIRHTGSHSEITDEGTGDLRLGSNRTVIGNATFSETQARFIQDGAVELYYDNSLKLSTGNNGINVSGSIALADNGRLYLGSSNDAYLFHDGGNTHFYNATGHLQIRQEANADVIVEANNIDRVRIYSDGVVAIGQSSKSSTVGAGNLDIQGNATSCIIEMGNPFPTFSGGVVPEFRITATNSGHAVDFASVWGGDNLLHKHLSFSGGITAFHKGTTSDEVARFNQDKFFIGQTTGSSRLCVSDTNPVIAELHHSDGGTNDEARLILGALANNPPSNRGAGIAAVNNGAGHGLTVKCSTNHSSGPGEKVRFKSNGDVSISDGNLIVASGHGIDFSATTNYGTSTPAELLDDYEEGQFQPNWAVASGSINRLTYRGEYCKIGRVVHCMWSMSTNGTSSPSGQVTITGFPFSAEVPSANGPRGGGGVIYGGYGTPSTISRTYIQGTTLYILLSDGSHMEASDFTNTGYNGGQLSGMITYLTTT